MACIYHHLTPCPPMAFHAVCKASKDMARTQASLCCQHKPDNSTADCFKDVLRTYTSVPSTNSTHAQGLAWDFLCRTESSAPPTHHSSGFHTGPTVTSSRPPNHASSLHPMPKHPVYKLHAVQTAANAHANSRDCRKSWQACLLRSITYLVY